VGMLLGEVKPVLARAELIGDARWFYTRLGRRAREMCIKSERRHVVRMLSMPDRMPKR